MYIIKNINLRYDNISVNKTNNPKKSKQPMKIFTPEEMKPSEKTLNIIRQIAYTYRVSKQSDGKACAYCLN